MLYLNLKLLLIFQYVTDGKWARKTEEISKYLAEKLKVDVAAGGAASAVHGHWMVKVVTSTRSGVGNNSIFEFFV